MSDPAPRPTVWQTLRNAALSVDSWLDHTVYVAMQSVRGVVELIYSRSNRLQVRGWRRLGVELACEGLTIGVAGSIVALALAIPAFQETKGNWLKKADVAVTFLDRYGMEIGQRGILHNDAVPLSEMPDYVIKAVLATEDRRFYEHFGIDVPGTIRALAVNAQANAVVQGGSSLSQQLAKNLFLSNERTLQRKIKEAYLAIWLEFHLTKDEILKLYLDRAYMGGGAFGIEAASQYYFGKSVRDVSLSEAAMLAGLFKAPTKYAPHVNLAAARARANQVLSNMVEAGFLTEGQVYGARRNPAVPIDRSASQAPDYYLDWAFTEITNLSVAGKLGDESVFIVKTPLDPDIQRAAENALESMLRQYGEQYNASQGAIVVMDPDGAVRAMVGGRDYGQSQFNRATDALRQPGSSFKPFVYATAFQNGFRPDSIVPDAPICIKNWCPQNYGRSYAGRVTLTTALVKSINTIPVRLSVQMGKDSIDGRRKIIDTAHAMGITTELKESWALPIGVEAVTVLDMTASYGVFASGGYKATPHAALEVWSRKGELIYRADPKDQNPLVLNPGVIADINPILNLVTEQGTARKALIPGVKVAGKTGTTNSYRDAWFVGFTGNYVAGVWYGNDDYESTNKMTGGSLPAMTWQQVMAAAHNGIDIRPIPAVMPFDTVPPAGAVAQTEATTDANGGIVDLQQRSRAAGLSRETIETLRAIETMMRDAKTERSASIVTAPAAPVAETVRTPAFGGGGGVSWSNGRWVVR
ncbi:MAG: transglycosylase domain-containing protein [Labrys sp. (in: a-proteobacteria)]